MFTQLYHIRSILISLLFLVITDPSSYSQTSSEQKDEKLLLSTLPTTIRRSLDKFPKLEDRITFLLGQIDSLHHSDEELSAQLVDSLLVLTKPRQLGLAYAKALWWKAHIYSEKHRENYNNQVALVWAKGCTEIFEASKDKFWLARSYQLEADIYYNLYNYPSALKYNKLAKATIDQVEKTDEKYWEVQGDIARLHGNLCYSAPGDPAKVDSGQYYYDQSRNFYEKANDEPCLAQLEENLAIVFNDHRSDSLYQEALKHYQALGLTNYLIGCKLAYGTFCLEKYQETFDPERYQLGLSLLREALAMHPKEECEILERIGGFFHYEAYHKKYFTNQDPVVAIDSAFYYYKKSLQLAAKENNRKCLDELKKAIAHFCSIVDLTKCQRLYEQIDTTYSEFLNNALATMERAKEENKLLQQQITIQKLKQSWGIALAIIFGLIAIFSFAWYRTRAIGLRKALRSHLVALRSQMNPHFISNTLNAIDSLINQGRNEEASNYIIDFSRLCRMILDNSNNRFISLENELDTLQYFISLEKLRLGENLRYKINVDDRINPTVVNVPPLLLQPFVENAIWHGIQKKQAPGELSIDIKINDEGFVEFTITDDGIGREKAQALQEQSLLDRKSHGISITKERITALKKIKGSELDIIDLYNSNGEAIGTKVFILLPLIDNPKIYEN